MVNRLYPQVNQEPTFDDRWQPVALPVEQPQFNLNVAVPKPVEQPTWQQQEATQAVEALGLNRQTAMQAHAARPAGRVKLTPVEGNPFSESHLNPVNIAKNIANSKRSGLGMAFDLATDNFIVNSIKSGVTLPADVISGRVPLRDAEGRINETVVERALDTAGLAAGGAFATRPGTATLGSGPVRPIKPAKENIFDVASSNFNHGRVIGNRTVSIENLRGGVGAAADDAARVEKLATKMKSPEGYIERLIVDEAGNVIEGQHRLDALRMNGETRVPVTVIKDLERGYDIDAMRKAIKDSGVAHSDQIHQYIHNTLEMLHDEKGNVNNILNGYELNPVYRAALGVALKADSSAPATAIAAAKGINAPRFYSAVENAVVNNPQAKATGDQWLATIQNARGVKPEELDWIGLREFLQENKGKPVTREQVQEYINNNKVEIKEVQNFNVTPEMESNLRAKFEADNPMPASNSMAYADWQKARRAFVDEQLGKVGLPKYKDYQLPGGENYREMLLTLPEKPNPLQIAERRYSEIIREFDKNGRVSDATQKEWDNLSTQIADLRRQGMKGVDEIETANNYRSSHWSEPNVLAHVRMNDRQVGDKKSLHLEEIQSDWHQAGRQEGYKVKYKPDELSEVPVNDPLRQGRDNQFWFVKAPDNVFQIPKSKANTLQDAINYIVNEKNKGGGNVPDAPFKKTWHELALKRMLREAAERGYERLSWTPGEAQAARYDLSKMIDEIVYYPNTKDLQVFKNGKEVIYQRGVEQNNLSNYIGKEAAEKLIKNPTKKTAAKDGGENLTLSGVDLKVGGEGMTGFYDNIIPKALEKIGKEWGIKVQKGKANDSSSVYQYFNEKTGKKHDMKFKSEAEAAEWAKKQGGMLSGWKLLQTNRRAGFDQPAHDVFYIDIPQQMRESLNQKGLPLFAGGGIPFIFTPVSFDPFAQNKE